MKKIITILAFLYAISNFGQDILVEPGTGKKYFYKKKTVWVPASIEIRGKGDNPAIAARVIEVLGLNDGESKRFVKPVVTKNKGYGKNGTFSKIYIDGTYAGEVQFLEATAKKTRYITDGSATITTTDIQNLCPTQLATLRRMYETVVAKGYNKEIRDRVYVEETDLPIIPTIDTVKTTPVSEVKKTVVNIDDFDLDVRKQRIEAEPVVGNYGRIKTDEKKVVTPTANQLPSSIYTYKTYEVEQKVVVDWCKTNRTNYPDLFDLYQKTHTLKVFNGVPGWSNRMDLKHCASGKTYIGRNWGWIAASAAGLIFTAVDYKSDKINVIFHPKDPNGNGIPHTEPKGIPHTEPKKIKSDYFNNPRFNFKI